jgi:hypothetical protein
MTFTPKNWNFNHNAVILIRKLIFFYSAQLWAQNFGQPCSIEHILNVYKWDKRKIVRLCYKLTDAHLAPVGQDAMKVSLAA